MPKKLLSLLRRPAVILLLAAELLVLSGALAVALRPAVTYEFAADTWESIAQTSQISTDENGFVGVSEMTDGEDILRTPSMVLPAGHYIVTVDYNYVGGRRRAPLLHLLPIRNGWDRGKGLAQCQERARHCYTEHP